MNDENPQSGNGSSNKSWVEKIAQFFQGEPKNREELADVIQDAEERELIDPQTKEMMQGVLQVSEQRVRDIMIPRSQMITIDINQSFEEFLPVLLDSAHSRFPVINEDKDHVEGILLAKDMLRYAFDDQAEKPALRDIIRTAIIVPESKKVDTLLREFRQKRYHMAMVVDEYGGVSGLVTIEDILEEIVGEIEDEHDADDNLPDNIRHIASSVYSVQALTPLEDFNEFFQTRFEEADTIGGIILHAFGHMPGRGEHIDIDGINFKVTNADNRRIQNIQVTLPKTEKKIPEQLVD